MKANLVMNKRGQQVQNGFILDTGELGVVADMLRLYLASRQRQGVDPNAEEYDEFCLMWFEEIQPWLDAHDYTEINARIAAVKS